MVARMFMSGSAKGRVAARGVGVNGGCVYLLSGGTSEADSWFIGASESGDDVFLATRAKLAPQDRNDSFDFYDIRVDGTSR